MTRHKPTMPADELGMDLKDRYKEFLMAAQEEGQRLADAEGFRPGAGQASVGPAA